tara:strand:- start:120 stop:560 length:441 start_codon:yes stop_codon:yes gene_type:complete
MSIEIIKYSNARTDAVIENWPNGGKRTAAHFWVEPKKNKGERAVRQTTNPKTGQLCKPKTLTYATKVCIVDGSDGKTYILEWSVSFRFITVMQSNMKYQQEVVHQQQDNKDNPRYKELLDLMGINENDYIGQVLEVTFVPSPGGTL